jgi:porphyrinogen peroxidase
MLENMFVGRPPGNYDRILDFSRALTGSLFFAPSATFLEAMGEDQPAVVAEPAADPATAEGSLSTPGRSDGSLGIGSLKGEIPHE